MKRSKPKIKSTNLHELAAKGLNYFDNKNTPKKADAILMADLHLMESTPICRTDDFMKTQIQKLYFISDLAKTHNCPVIHSGDLFDFWKPSPMLLSLAIKYLPERFWTVYGNHDLPQHNLELSYKSGVNTLGQAKRIEILRGCHWGQTPKELGEFELFGRQFLVWHTMAYQSNNPYGMENANKAASLLRKYHQYDVILTGDNHASFVEKHDGRILINPGSVFRLKADQIEYRPRVYLYYTDINDVVPIYLPIEKEVISREHLELQEQRENRINAFISTLEMDWSAELSFEENIIKFCSKNNVRNSVKNIILKSFES